MPKSQTEALFLAHIAFPRFRENPELVPRVFQKSTSVIYRDSISETRERELPVFRDPRKRETRQQNKGVLVNPGGLEPSFLLKRHTFPDAKVCILRFWAPGAGAKT